MEFIADLHIHSRFSRATAKNLNFENLYMAARLKGISVVATGDFTHPAWFSEILEKLVPAEPGVFKLKQELESSCDKRLPFPNHFPVRFILSAEISNIYKKSGKTRKIHNLVFFPDLPAAARFNARLDKIGNIHSDGRPILGLDAKHLLEIVLETSDQGFLVPAHIWTPWFSLFGSKSGFDALEECFEDLSPHIFAVETGLSSDPAMNWRVTDLDGRTIISNSDAHSPANLGREANLFNTDLSYAAIKSALETGNPDQFLGTLEFYPQEGKYHHDGHRKCNVNLHPAQSISLRCLCPVCGQPLTLGVLHRVEELAHRPEGQKPDKTHPFYNIIPLAEMMAEIAGAGVKSKKVDALYSSAVARLGPELDILHKKPLTEIEKAGIPLLAEAVMRMRQGRIHIVPGYDGEYGRITVFSPGEIDALLGQQSFFCGDFAQKNHITHFPETPKGPVETNNTAPLEAPMPKEMESVPSDAKNLNAAQKKAVMHGQGPAIIVAGPGTGKTLTLTHRMAYLIKYQKVDAATMLAVTFTQKAAQEMTERLRGLLGKDAPLPLTATFHAFCYKLLKEQAHFAGYTIIDDAQRLALVKEAMGGSAVDKECYKIRPETACDFIIKAKQHILSPSDDLGAICRTVDVQAFSSLYAAYQDLVQTQKVFDYEDLIFWVVKLLESDPNFLKTCRNRFQYILVDEYQDLNLGQYRLIKALAPEDGNIFVIGDPDQAIYGFRGADVAFFQRFLTDFPGAAQFRLTQNHRSAQTILDASLQVIRNHSLHGEDTRLYSGISGINAVGLMAADTEKAEAVMVGKAIEQMVGGLGFDFEDFGKAKGEHQNTGRVFSDFAVLYRTHALGDVFADVFSKAGIPFQRVSQETIFQHPRIQTLMAWFKLMARTSTYLDLGSVVASFDETVPRQDIIAIQGLLRENPHALDPGMDPAPVMEGLSNDGKRVLKDILRRVDAYAVQTLGWPIEKKLLFLNARIPKPAAWPEREGMDLIEYLARVSKPFGADVEAFLNTVALQHDPDIYDAKSQKVALMTFHAAKGLEFPVVFIVGCEDGWVPLIRKDKTPCDLNEERRLLYVAMTRAKQELFFTCAKTRRIFGTIEHRRWSRFLDDIEKSLIRYVTIDLKPKAHKQVQLTLF